MRHPIGYDANIRFSWQHLYEKMLERRHTHTDFTSMRDKLWSMGHEQDSGEDQT